VSNLEIDALVSLLNQGIREFDQIKGAFLNVDRRSLERDSSGGGIGVGMLRTYTEYDLPSPGLATPGNYREKLRELALKVDALRSIQWAAPVKTRLRQVPNVGFDDPVLKPSIFSWATTASGGEEIQDSEFSGGAFGWLDDCRVGGGYYSSSDVSILTYYESSTTDVNFIVSPPGWTDPPGGAEASGGTGYVVTWRNRNSSGGVTSSSALSGHLQPIVMQKFEQAGEYALTDIPADIAVAGAWEANGNPNGQSNQVFVPTGISQSDTLSSKGFSYFHSNLQSANAPRWRVFSRMSTVVFLPNFKTGLDRTGNVALTSLKDTPSSGLPSGELEVFPDAGILAGISIGEGVKGGLPAVIGILNSGHANRWNDNLTVFNFANPVPVDVDAFGVRYPAMPSALRLLGSAGDFRIFFEAATAEPSAWDHHPFFEYKEWHGGLFYRASMEPRMRQVIGRSVIVDIVSGGDGFGSTLKIHRRVDSDGFDDALAPVTPNGPLIASYTLGPAGGLGGDGYPVNPFSLDVNRSSDGAAWTFTPSNKGQDYSVSFKSGITTLKTVSLVCNDAAGTITRTDSELGATTLQKVAELDNVLDPAWPMISQSHASGYQEAYSPDSRFPTSLNILRPNLPETNFQWTGDGLPVFEQQGQWRTDFSMVGNQLQSIHKLRDQEYGRSQTRWEEGGAKITTVSTPDGSAGPSQAIVTNYRISEPGHIPWTPMRIDHGDGTGSTYQYTLDGGVLTALSRRGALTGGEVVRGVSMTEVTNRQGMPVSRLEKDIASNATLASQAFGEFSDWGAPTTVTDLAGRESSWAFDGARSRLQMLTGPLGESTSEISYDRFGRMNSYKWNNHPGTIQYTNGGLTMSGSLAISGRSNSFTDQRDIMGQAIAGSVTAGSTFGWGVSRAEGQTSITTEDSTTGAEEVRNFRNDDGSLAIAQGDTLPFGGTNGTTMTVDYGLLKTTAELVDQSAAYQTTWTDAWGRIRKTQTPSTAPSGTDETEFVYSDPDSSVKRVRVTQASGRVLITESDPYNASGMIRRSGIDVDGNGSLGTSDRFVESVTTVSGGNLVTTLSLTEDTGLREILRTAWTPSGGQTVTTINGSEETITRTPDYSAKTVTTSSTKGWSKTDTFNNLGLTTNSSLSGTGVPSAALTPVWRDDGSLSGVTFTAGGDTHSASFNNDGTLSTLTAPGKGNILGGHSVSGGTETLTVDGVTTERSLDGTLLAVTGGDIPSKTEELATNGSGFKHTTTPTVGAATEVTLNAAGAPTAKAYAAGAGESYTSYKGGLIHTVSLARGGDLTFGYSNDGAKDLTSATWPAVVSGQAPNAFNIPSVVQSYGHDRAGRVDEIGDSSGARALVYQSGRLKQTTWNSGPLAGYKVVKGLDEYGRDTGFTLYRGSTVIHSAVKAPNGVSGEVSELASGALKVVVGRNGARQVTGFQWGNAAGTFVPTVAQRWQRGTAGRILLADSNSTVSGAPTFDYTGTANNEATAFDLKGRRLKVKTAGADWTYQYTNGQITSATHPTLGSFSYQFDGIGRRKNHASSNNYADLLNRTLDWENDQDKTLKVIAHPDARVWVNGSEIPSFTGSHSYAVPSPGASGGWVPWTTLAVLEGEGDAGANADAKAEQSGAVWVPPVSESFEYDDAGNRESSNLWVYGWNAKNELVRARTKGYNDPTIAQGYDISFDYDAEGRRFKKAINRYQSGQIAEQKVITFVWDGWDLLYERHQLPSGLTLLERKYLWGPDIADGSAGGAGGLLLIRETKGNTTTDIYPLYDGTGHVTALTNSSSELLAQYAYGPFGEKIHGNGPLAQSNPWRYATKYFDAETGLYYYGKRYLDPVTGQWLSREPLGENQSLNLYSLAGNDPVNHADAFGLAKIDLKAPVKIIPVPGMAGRFQVWFSVIEGNQANEWEEIGHYPSSTFIGEATKARFETDPEYCRQQQIQAMRSLVDRELLAGDLELLKIKEDTATLLPGGHAAVAISREEYGKAAGWIVGEGVVATVGGELLGRGLSYAGKTGYLMASGSTLAESRLILGLSKELATGTLTSGSSAAATPLYATAEGALARTTGALDSGGTTNLTEYVFGPKAIPKIHGNKLSSPGPHDVYVMRDAQTGRIYHFGETGRGFETRGTEWARKLQKEYGLDAIVEPLRTLEGKSAAKALESRYIKTYEKIFGFKPGYVDDVGNFIPIQKTRH
jgi:RHS repeat-associated protein